MSDFSRETHYFSKTPKPTLFNISKFTKGKSTHRSNHSIPHSPYILNPSDEFSRTHYSKANFQRVLSRNVLTPQTPQIDKRRCSNPGEKIVKTQEMVRPPTEAFNKWKNDDKCKLLLVEDLLKVEEGSKFQFKRFDDAMITQTSWVKSFDQEKTLKDLLFKQLTYNENNQKFLESTLNSMQQVSVHGLIDQIGNFQKKVEKMPPIKKTKKKPQKIKMEEDFGSFSSFDTYGGDEETVKSYSFFWTILNQTSWKPGVREGATLLYNDGKIYLYGGLSNELLGDLCELNVESNLFLENLRKLKANLFRH